MGIAGVDTRAPDAPPPRPRRAEAAHRHRGRRRAPAPRRRRTADDGPRPHARRHERARVRMDARLRRVAARRDPAQVARGRDRLRRQAEHPALLGRRRLQGHRRSGDHVSADEILALDPDGIFLSNGPGDPAAVTHAIETIQRAARQEADLRHLPRAPAPVLALGGKTYKLKFGHRGLNQPVKDLATGRVEITTQNHGFCVDVDSLRRQVRVTHLHLNDGTAKASPHESGAFSVQYHPEASAGPHDARYLFSASPTASPHRSAVRCVCGAAPC